MVWFVLDVDMSSNVWSWPVAQHDLITDSPCPKPPIFFVHHGEAFIFSTSRSRVEHSKINHFVNFGTKVKRRIAIWHLMYVSASPQLALGNKLSFHNVSFSRGGEWVGRFEAI